MKNNRLANNIGILRTVFGETQLDLALVLGFNSPNTISNYESGNRKPNDETIRKLARHYRITEYELCNVDLSDCLVVKNLFAKNLANIENRNKEILKTFFPIVCTKEAKKNENFLKTNNRHRELIDKLSENFNEDYVDELYFEIDEVYSDLFFENNDYVSLANSLGIQCYTEFLEKFNEECFSGNKIENLPSNPKYKDVYLRVFFDDGLESEVEEEEYIESDIKLLIKCHEYKDLAYYYTAFRYVYGFADKNLTFEMSSLIGRTMMEAFGKAGNKYAFKYIRVLNNLIEDV